MMFPEKTLKLAEKVVHGATKKKLTITTAESCTGGLVSGAITEIPGSSACLYAALVTYHNFMKTKFLGVSEENLNNPDIGAVSEATAREMATGALKAATADIAIAISGIAGPDGGSREKPVGTVHFATARRVDGTIQTHHERHFIKKQSRSEIRLACVEIALSLLLQEIEVS